MLKAKRHCLVALKEEYMLSTSHDLDLCIKLRRCEHAIANGSSISILSHHCLARPVSFGPSDYRLYKEDGTLLRDDEALVHYELTESVWNYTAP